MSTDTPSNQLVDFNTTRDISCGSRKMQNMGGPACLSHKLPHHTPRICLSDLKSECFRDIMARDAIDAITLLLKYRSLLRTHTQYLDNW